MKSINDPRHNARRIALGTLFCAQFSNADIESCRELTSELLTPQEYEESLTQKIIDGTNKYISQIDGIIERCAPEWPIDKISKVDLTILRLAVYEVLYEEGVPDKVVIDEAVELAKEFGSDTSKKFINGVLGTVIEIKASIQNTESEK